MNKKMYWLGFTFFSIVPLLIITQRHLKHEDGGYRYGFIGIILLITVIYFAFIKKMENRVNTWDIQDKHKDKVIAFRCLKPILIISAFTYIAYSISVNIDMIMWTLVYVLASMIIGFLLEYASVVLSP